MRGRNDFFVVWPTAIMLALCLTSCSDLMLNNAGDVISSEPTPVPEIPLTPKESKAVKLRKAFAAKLREGFLDEGSDVYVTTEDRLAKTIRFRYVFMGEVWKHQFEKSALINRIYDQGFREIRYTDGDDFNKGTILGR